MTRDSVMGTSKSQKMQRRVRFSRPEISDTHTAGRGEASRTDSYRSTSRGSSNERVQRSSSRRSQQANNTTVSYQAGRDEPRISRHNQLTGAGKSQYNPLTGAGSSLPPCVVYSNRPRTQSSYFAGSKSGATPMPTVLPLPPQHWLGNVNVATPVMSCQQSILNEPSEGDLRCLGMTNEIKSLLRMH